MSHITLLLDLLVIVDVFSFLQSVHVASDVGLRGSPNRHLLSLHDGHRTNGTQNGLVTTNTTATDAAQLLKAADAYFANASMTSSAAYKAWAAKIQEMAVSAVQGKSKVLEEPSAEAQQCDIQQQYSAAPDLCSQPNNRIPREKLMQYMTHFKNVWAAFKTQFGDGETCCMGINHQFAIFTTVKELQPLVIIESGVAAGRGTWLLRHSAGPNVPIFSLDPGVPKNGYPGRSWTDESSATTYLTGANFQDLALVRWDVVIPDPAWRARTLVILDDHQSSIERLKMLRRWGFRYVFYEDNYPFKVATSTDKYTCEKLQTARAFNKPLYGDAYSPNTVCASVPPPWNFVLEKDRFGHKCQFLTLPQHAVNVKWFQDHLQDYFEFPALFSRCTGLTREPLLGQDPATLNLWGFPQPDMELWRYGHLFPALMELKPLQPSEVIPEYQAALSAVAALYTEIVTHQWP